MAVETAAKVDLPARVSRPRGAPFVGVEASVEHERAWGASLLRGGAGHCCQERPLARPAGAACCNSNDGNCTRAVRMLLPTHNDTARCLLSPQERQSMKRVFDNKAYPNVNRRWDTMIGLVSISNLAWCHAATCLFLAISLLSSGQSLATLSIVLLRQGYQAVKQCRRRGYVSSHALAFAKWLSCSITLFARCGAVRYP